MENDRCTRREESNKVTGTGCTIIKRREGEVEGGRGKESPKKRRKAEIFPGRSAAGIM